jgi:hypothetical protein
MSELPIQFDRQKFKAAVHYICASAQAPELGRIKLHKILFLSDLMMYAARTKPITGAAYQRQPFGPIARHLDWALGELQREGALDVRCRLYYGANKIDFFSLRAPDIDLLAGDERRLIDDVVAFVCKNASNEWSELNYEDTWRSFAVGDEIPYCMCFSLFPCEITDDDVNWGNQQAALLFGSAAAE